MVMMHIFLNGIYFQMYIEGLRCMYGIQPCKLTEMYNIVTVKPVLSGHSKEDPKICFQD